MVEGKRGRLVCDTIRALVRPFLAVAFSLASIVLAFMGMLQPAIIATAATAIIAFYFGERGALKVPGNGTENG